MTGLVKKKIKRNRTDQAEQIKIPEKEKQQNNIT